MIKIGSSDVAPILGVSPYRGPWDIWAKAHGLIPDVSADDDAKRRGRLVEPGLREELGARIGVIPRPGPAYPTPGWQAPDGWRSAREDCTWGEPDSLGIGELKTADGWGGYGPDGSDGVPVWYYVQALHQAGVATACGFTVTRLVLFATVQTYAGFDAPRLYDIPVDHDRIARLADKCRAWYERHIVVGDMPDPDASKACRQALAERFKVARPELVDPTDEDRAMVTELAMLRGDKRDAEKAAKAIEAQLLLRTGDAAGMRDLFSVSRVKGRTTIDGKGLIKAHPDIAATFTRTGAPSLRLNLKDSPESGEE